MTEADGAGPYAIRGFKEDGDRISAAQQMIEREPRGLDYPEIRVATDQSARPGTQTLAAAAACGAAWQ